MQRPQGTGVGEEAWTNSLGHLPWEKGDSGLRAQSGSVHSPSWVQPSCGWQVTQSRPFFTQPFLWCALLPGIWDICRKSGTVCGIPQPSQLASCCRWLKPQPRPAPQQSGERGSLVRAINQSWWCHPRRISRKNKIKTPDPKYPPREDAGSSACGGQAGTTASGIPNYRGAQVPECHMGAEMCLSASLPTVALATSFLTASRQKHRLPCAPTSFPTLVGRFFIFLWRVNFRFGVSSLPTPILRWGLHDLKE